jgi:hypothetical protein
MPGSLDIDVNHVPQRRQPNLDDRVIARADGSFHQRLSEFGHLWRFTGIGRLAVSNDERFRWRGGVSAQAADRSALKQRVRGALFRYCEGPLLVI